MSPVKQPTGGKPTRCILHFVSLVLLLSFSQLLWALIWFHGQFISSAEALISPFNFCLRRQDGVLVCINDYSTALGNTSGIETNINVPRVMVILSLYTPLVLVPFALMALQFALRGEEAGLLWFSVVSQAASSLLVQLGIAAFLGLHWAYVSLTDLTLELYICECVCVKLAITAWFTWMSASRLAMTETKSEPVDKC